MLSTSAVCCSGGTAQYPASRLLTSSAPQQTMAELMAEIAANEYAASGGGNPLVQRAAQVTQLPHGHPAHSRPDTIVAHLTPAGSLGRPSCCCRVWPSLFPSVGEDTHTVI